MPLVSIPGSEAVRIRKDNPAAQWGDRSAPNRVEPIAKPTFAAPFRLQRSESIFTVGSCFARHVELELEARGFNLPFCNLLTTPAFAGVDRGLLNNFGTPSIYNELLWALEPESCNIDDQLVQLGNGKYVPFHYRMKPDAKDVVVDRLERIREAYRKARECRVVIMTLGLVEVWFDTKTGTYLNLMPLPSLLKQNPDRFQLHTLTFDETYKFLDAALQLLKKHGRRDLQVILTVSPVPMQATHRPMDVLVANTYSKSVLRTAAETAVTSNDFITYFPSYESLILSDRRRAWQDDLVHPTQEMISFNVTRMLDAYLDPNDDLDGVAAEIEKGGMLVAAQKAAAASQRDGDYAKRFFLRFGHLSSQSADFAREHAAFLGKTDQAAAARILAVAPGEDIETLVLRGRMLVKAEQFAEAIALLSPHARRGAHGVWTVLLDAHLASGNHGAVPAVLARYLKALPSQGRMAVYGAAENRQRRGLKKQAAILYFAAAQLLPAMPGVQRNVKEFLQKEAPDLASKLQASGPVMTRGEVRQLLMEQAPAA